MAGRFGGPVDHPRQSWRAPYQIQKEERIARQRMKIPVCQSCGVRCTVCAPKFGQPARCCLSSQLAREGQIQTQTPPEHPYDGGSCQFPKCDCAEFKDK